MEAILDFLESSRNSLQFAYKICLQEVCEEEEKCILMFGSDADFWKILHTGILDQSHCKDDNFLLVTRIWEILEVLESTRNSLHFGI